MNAPAVPLDRAVFLRPIAHRGLHNAGSGIIENTAQAFEAAIARGYGIECDLRPAHGGSPVVFHDETLDRLVDGTGPVSALTADDLTRFSHRGSGAGILTFAQLISLVDGRVPLLVEIKSEWTPPDQAFLAAIAQQASVYRGPIALMSFDPAVIAALGSRAPGVPRGLVSGSYRTTSRDSWWQDTLAPERANHLRDLGESHHADESTNVLEQEAK